MVTSMHMDGSLKQFRNLGASLILSLLHHNVERFDQGRNDPWIKLRIDRYTVCHLGSSPYSGDPRCGLFGAFVYNHISCFFG